MLDKYIYGQHQYTFTQSITVGLAETETAESFYVRCQVKNYLGFKYSFSKTDKIFHFYKVELPVGEGIWIDHLDNDTVFTFYR